MHSPSLPSAGPYRPATFLDGHGLVNLVRRWLAFIAELRDPYRPEQHYMRGPGPKWHAKHDALGAAGRHRTPVNRKRLA